MDATPADPCATDDATSTVGCNGAMLGPQADDALFGSCVPDEVSDQGSCTDATALCYAYDVDVEESAVGVCVPPCTPNGSTYVNTSTCPAGSRCFDFGDGSGFCFADCSAGTDCATGACDVDNTCVGSNGAPMDGGVPDGGVFDGGMPDGGTPDGGAPDSGAPDSGAPDAGCSGVELTVHNILSWCSVSIDGAAFSTAATQQVCVSATTPIPLVHAPASGAFILGDWHHTDGDSGSGDPGTVSAGMSSASITTGAGGTACVWVCCPFTDGSGCAVADPCP